MMFSSVRLGRVVSTSSFSGLESLTGMRWTRASAVVLQKPDLSMAFSLKRVILRRVDGPLGLVLFFAPASSVSSSSSPYEPAADSSYPVMSSFSLCQKMYFSTKLVGSIPARNLLGTYVWVPNSELKARVISRLGAGVMVVMGTPVLILSIPPTRSGYGSPLTSCRQRFMLLVYSNTLKCRLPCSLTLNTVTTGGFCHTITSLSVCVLTVSPPRGFSIHPASRT
mmetsp:Transcript_40346/g.74669  ORF Transcript_40346/g.74669 Transcript_40346/m.74669 type:complete len:224 (-) Transcript_40346:2495-3166(-)